MQRNDDELANLHTNLMLSRTEEPNQRSVTFLVFLTRCPPTNVLTVADVRLTKLAAQARLLVNNYKQIE